MSRRIRNNLKGKLGEIFFENEFEVYGLVSPHSMEVELPSKGTEEYEKLVDEKVIKCDKCGDVAATYCKTTSENWAYLCDKCEQEIGVKRKKKIAGKTFTIVNPPIFQSSQDEEDLKWKCRIKKLGTTHFPDFLVKGTKILIEVKTGKYAELENYQKKEFTKILENGYRIFLIKPKLNIERRKFELTGFDCYEFNGYNNHKEKMTIKKVKQIIEKEMN